MSETTSCNTLNPSPELAMDSTRSSADGNRAGRAVRRQLHERISLADRVVTNRHGSQSARYRRPSRDLHPRRGLPHNSSSNPCRTSLLCVTLRKSVGSDPLGPHPLNEGNSLFPSFLCIGTDHCLLSAIYVPYLEAFVRMRANLYDPCRDDHRRRRHHREGEDAQGGLLFSCTNALMAWLRL